MPGIEQLVAVRANKADQQVFCAGRMMVGFDSYQNRILADTMSSQMATSTKISISLPERLFKAAERERRAKGETRSEFFRRAVDDLLRRERERAAVAAYVEGYVSQPETPYETEAADRLGQDALAGEPW